MRSTGRASKRMRLSPWSARASFRASRELEREGRVVFFLQSPHPFTGIGHESTAGKMRIKAPWAERADTAEHLVDSEFRPIYRLRLWSAPLKSFALKTDFTRS
jgi:hypothetical protein